MNTYVLVGGAWIGAWAWESVAARLWAAGHDVYPLSLTGLGERAHLGGPDVDLDTHITDVTRLIELEDLHDVILVGHSYAGVVIPGVGDRIPERVAQLVYLDSGPLTDGVALIDTFPPEARAHVERQVREHGDGWAWPMPSWEELAASGSSLDGLVEPERELMRSNAAAHPFGTYTQPLRLRNPALERLPKVAILCSFSREQVQEMIAHGHPLAAGFDTPGWEFVELPTSHWPMLSAPRELAQTLDGLRTAGSSRGDSEFQNHIVGSRML